MTPLIIWKFHHVVPGCCENEHHVWSAFHLVHQNGGFGDLMVGSNTRLCAEEVAYGNPLDAP